MGTAQHEPSSLASYKTTCQSYRAESATVLSGLDGQPRALSLPIVQSTASCQGPSNVLGPAGTQKKQAKWKKHGKARRVSCEGLIFFRWTWWRGGKWWHWRQRRGEKKASSSRGALVGFSDTL